MKYTAGELRKMNGRKCKLQYKDKPEAEWEIYVKDWRVNFVSNNIYYDGWFYNKQWFGYSWALYCDTRSDHEIKGEVSITFTEEAKQTNIYYDDNWEEIKEWDWVLVAWNKRIFLCKVPRSEHPYICVDSGYAERYKTSSDIILRSNRSTCIKYKEPERKLRELYMTDEEREEFQKRNNIQ